MIKKKIIHLITTIERGGAENQLLILVREQIAQGMDVEIFYLKGKPELADDFSRIGAHVRHQLANRNFITQYFLFRKIVHKSNLFIHTHLAQAEILAAIVCKKKRFLVSRHNFEPFWPNKPSLISRAISQYTSAKAGACIAISKAVKDYLVLHREVRPKVRIEVIYYGIERINSQSNNEPKIIDSELSSKKIFKIGTIGRLVSGKDYLTMFKSIKLVSEKVPNVKFFIVGTGKSEIILKKICKNMQLENHIVWMGKTSYIGHFLNQIDLFIFASKGEGFGLVLLEAMSAKKAILAPNNSAIPEVLGFDYPGLYPTGDYKSLADKILSLNGNLILVNDFISGYNSQLSLFDSKVMANKVIKLYESIGF